MAIFKFRRKARARKLRRARAAPLLAEPAGLSATLQRANRMLAGVSLFGAFGAVALAVALTPDVQPSSPSANAAKASLAVSGAKAKPAPHVKPPPPAPVLAALPRRAEKSDRLSRPLLSPQPAAVETAPDGEPLRPSVREPITIVMAPQEPDAAPAARLEARFRPALTEDLETDIEPAAGLGPTVPLRGDTQAEPGAETGNDVIERGIGEEIGQGPEDAAAPIEEAIEKAVEEAVGIAVEQAPPEPEPETATRQAAVTTDVNMRAKPDNGAAVILVIPGKSDIEVIGCDYWCDVVYAGKRGWIYKGFVRNAKS